MITQRLHIIAIGAVVIFSALISAYQLGKHNQRQQSALAAAQLVAKTIQKRADLNEKIINLDNVGLCLELGGLPEDCQQLRGMAGNHP